MHIIKSSYIILFNSNNDNEEGSSIKKNKQNCSALYEFIYLRVIPQKISH